MQRPIANIANASILIVDNEPANVSLLEKIVRRAGYANVRATTQPETVEALCREAMPDIVLLDLHMPGLSGFEVMQRIRNSGAGMEPLVLMLTGDTSSEVKMRALSSGAKDFIAKPFDQAEVLLRIRNLADLRMLHVQLHRQNVGLEEAVRLRTADLEEARREVIERLAMAAEFRDDATGQHTRRVGQLAARIAAAMDIEPATVELLERAAPLHDVGKIAIPDHILLKPGPLSAEEMAIMQTHTTIGARLLSNSRSPLLAMAQQIALSHHERWDGTGYPEQRAGAEIP
ncbi:MAG: response regulator, partial [Gemmatimonadota bacterium]